MRYYFFIGIVLFGLLSSCNKTEKLKDTKQLQIQENTDSIFKSISETWMLTVPQQSDELKEKVSDWKSWKDLQNELKLKPVSSISAFQKKAVVLSSTSLELINEIPDYFNSPDIRSRISVICTLLNSLEMYINLEKIDKKQIVYLIPEINMAIESMISQMEEIIIKNNVSKEVGEEEMLKAIDTTRFANPNTAFSIP